MVSTKTQLECRKVWQKLCPDVLLLLLVVFLVLTFFRIYGTVGGGPGQAIMLDFLLMWFVPWVFLFREGRKAIGPTLPKGAG